MAILVRDSALQWSLAGISCVYKTALSGSTAMAVYEKQVRLPSDVLQDLGDHSGRWWSDPALEPIIVEAIRAFIKPALARRQEPTQSDTAGYQAQQSAAIARLFGGDAPTAHRARPPHPAPASRAKRARRPQSKPKNRTASSSSVDEIVHSDGQQRKHGAARGARRKRRAQKHVPVNP
jgi:hypothetical protein